MVVNRLNSFKQPCWQRSPLQIITTIHKQFPAGETRVEIDFFSKVISSTKYEWNLVREKIWNLNEMLNDSDVDKWEQKIRYRSRELLFQYFVHQQQVAVWRRTGGCWVLGVRVYTNRWPSGDRSHQQVQSQGWTQCLPPLTKNSHSSNRGPNWYFRRNFSKKILRVVNFIFKEKWRNEWAKFA